MPQSECSTQTSFSPFLSHSLVIVHPSLSWLLLQFLHGISSDTRACPTSCWHGFLLAWSQTDTPPDGDDGDDSDDDGGGDSDGGEDADNKD